MPGYGLSSLGRSAPVLKQIYYSIFGKPYAWTRGPLVLKHIGLKPGESVLDIGCRGGVLAAELKAAGARVVGLDIDRDMIGCEVETDAPVRQELNFVLADAHQLPFARTVFDKVVMSDCLEHIFDDTKAVCELAQALKPKGLFVVTVPTNPGYPPHRFFAHLIKLVPGKFLVRAHADNRGRTVEVTESHDGHLLAHADQETILNAFGHYRHYDEHSLSRVLQQAGLRVQHMERFQMLFESEMMYFEHCVKGMRSPLVYPLLRAVASLDVFLPSGYPGVGLLAVATR